jgi:hypothetical protein
MSNNTKILSRTQVPTINYPQETAPTMGSLALASFSRMALGNLNPIQAAALDLHDMNLNVIPCGFDAEGDTRKKPRAQFQFKEVGLTRWPMRFNDDNINELKLLMDCFAGGANVGIICGDVSENLLAIDCENGIIYHQYAKAMKERNIPLFAQQTGRGYHILLKADKPVNGKKITEGNHENGKLIYEIRGNGQYILATPSIHPSGAKYQWVNEQGQLSDRPFLDKIPTVKLAEIDFLTDGNGRPMTLKAVKPKSVASKRRDSYLANGQNTPEGSRETRLFQTACNMRFVRIPKTQAETLLIPIALESGLSAKEVYHAIDSAYQYSQKADGSEKQYRILEILKDFIVTYQWPKKTDRRVFEALIKRYEQDNFNYKNGAFSASIRNLAELAGLHFETVRSTLLRLQNQQKLVSRVDKNGRNATVYRLNIKLICDTLRSLMQSIKRDNYIDLNMSQNPISQDLRERGGLGDTGLRILRYIQNESRQRGKPTSAAAIAEALQIDRRTVYRYLSDGSHLLHYGLVEKVGKGWIAHESQAAEVAIAQSLGVVGKAQKRKDKHALDRSKAIVSAMHEQIVTRDKNHPLYLKTDKSKSKAEISKFEEEKQAETKANRRRAAQIARNKKNKVLRPDFAPLSVDSHEAMLEDFANEVGAEITTYSA